MIRLYFRHHRKPSNTPLVIGLTGDVMLGRLTNETILERGPRYPWGTMLEKLQALDGLIINLETTITRQTHAVPKVFNFKADPRTIAALQEARVTVANLANNHSLDFDIEGLAETLAILHTAQIQTIGAGMTLEAAQQPAIIEKNGVKIGVIGCTDNEPSWAASQNKPGTFFVDNNNLPILLDQIAKIRPHVDILIISYHWGPNWDDNPSLAIQERAHVIIDAGVDIIHGHSNHIVQGIEHHQHGIIIYGAGDFVDDYAVDPLKRNDYGALYTVAIRNKKVESLTVIPTQITNMQVNKADPSATDAVLQRIAAQSEKLSTTLTRLPDSLVISF
jgi:poly-gamma-glutamate synthesis protein (capsule biosynthesis protein)